ncbi:MAG: hypothetical protein ABIT71_15095 [Vicinamibacteraceae bacterium]
MRSVTRLYSLAALALFAVAAAPSPAAADLTAFLGVSPSPGTHLAKGAAVGMGLVVFGFEFEYSQLGEDVERAVPSLTTGSGNVLVQTPVPINGWQFYATLGGGVYRERLEDLQETHVSTNLGGGAKYTVAGPFRLRFDYRIFSLLGSPLQSKVHRFYAGANLAF